jgi:hypothetical protein
MRVGRSGEGDALEIEICERTLVEEIEIISWSGRGGTLE